LQSFPNLQISELLVLTLLVGFQLAFAASGLREVIAQPAAKYAIPKWHVVVPEIIDSTVPAVSLFGLLVLGRERLRRSEAPLAPGHWIVLSMGPLMVWTQTTSLFGEFVDW
jgi:hypothetical protein